ncbi:MAG: KUP/HAK/KT family potassium transporter [Bacteroidales bacterium]
MSDKTLEKGIPLSIGTMLITLGIVYGDIGTSPLYVMQSMFSYKGFLQDPYMIMGGISAVFWTLTLQTTIKYVLITLRADNNGEGGIFSLYALLKGMKYKWLYLIAIVGGSSLVADGVITCSITVTSAIEGLQNVDPSIPVIPIVVIIISTLYAFQRQGTQKIGKYFGPVMSVWFLMLGVLGVAQIFTHPRILEALSPVYAYRMLFDYPHTFILLGAVFLCTTGAEALYADLGHCGIRNIRMTWIYVKSMLMLNYLGQGAWLLKNIQTTKVSDNPFYTMMPDWFLIPGVIMATAAAIIASQALISGTFTLVSESISLNFFPQLKIKYPTIVKGQMYIPKINMFLWLGSMFVVFYFRESSRMQAAYGLAISITMLMTTVLMTFYLIKNKAAIWKICLFTGTFSIVETAFFLSNMQKFTHGGWFTLSLAAFFSLSMYAWTRGSEIRNRFIKFVPLKQYLPVVEAVSADTEITKTATHLIYMVNTPDKNLVDDDIVFSLINHSPKRADVYWLIYLNVAEAPYTCNYSITPVEDQKIFRVDINLGFRMDPKINMYFIQILNEQAVNGNVDKLSEYKSLRAYNYRADYRFVVIDRIKNLELPLSNTQDYILSYYYFMKKIGTNEIERYGLNSSNTISEYVPLGLAMSMEDKIVWINKPAADSSKVS